MKYSLRYLLLNSLVVILLTGCKSQPMDEHRLDHFPAFLKEGHRGARGLAPENTIPSMTQAIDDGANVLELDIQISKDKKVVVAHDPMVNPEFSLMPDGTEIPEKDANAYILYQMDYAEIRAFDVGSKIHKNFPRQRKMKVHMPLLGELIDSVEQYTTERKLPGVIYNIEIKSKPDKDGVYQPSPSELISLVMDVVNSKSIGDRFYIQSFDIRQIQEVKKKYPGVATGFLTSNKSLSFEDNIAQLGFQPDIYSPHYSLATPALIEKCNSRGIRFVPWTVNTAEEVDALHKLGVDGIITDYPDLLKEF